MSQNNPALNPAQIVDLVVKHRWYLLISLALAIVAGIVCAIALPRIYQASTLIIFQPQQVSDWVQPLTPGNADEFIDTISQKILSNTNLERIIRKFKLLKNDAPENMLLEDKINDLKDRIEIEVIADQSTQSDSFSISFKGEEPKTVMDIANTLASDFINQHLEETERKVNDTSSILEERLSVMRGRLEEVEEALKVYRKTYMGELPEQLESNLQILDRLQDQLGERQQSLSESKIQLASLQSLNTGDQTEESELSEIDQAYERLNEMKTRYTENHPDIVRLKEQIAKLEAEQSDPSNAARQEQADLTISSLPERQQEEAIELTGEIESLKEDISQIKGQIKVYQRRIENTPKREQELLSLNRDYQNIQTNYESLISRKLESEIAVDIHREQKGEQFKIVDQAQLPNRPIEPDLPQLFLIFIALGLGVGAGIIFLKETISSSFKSQQEVEQSLELPVLGIIPHIIQPSAKRWRRIEYGACICSTVLVVFLLGGFAAISFIGLEPTLEAVDKIINI